MESQDDEGLGDENEDADMLQQTRLLGLFYKTKFMPSEKNQLILKKGQKAVEVSALVSLGLAIFKGIIGLFSGSAVLLSSALDSLVDLMGQAASWLGFKISQRKPTPSFPYGYYKAESLATLLISLLILYAALRLFSEGFSRLFAEPALGIPLIAIFAALVNIGFSVFLSRYLEKVGQEISSPLLIACSNERRMDIFSGLAVLLAVFTSYLGIPYIEGIVVMAISLLILRVGIFSARDSAMILMDISPSGEMERKISSVIKGFKETDSFSSLKLRRSGPFVFGEVKLRVKKSLSVNKAHEIAEKIEAASRKEIAELDSLNVHIEPHPEGKCKIAIPVRNSEGKNSKTFPGIKKAPYMFFAVVDKDKGIIEKSYVRKKPLSDKKKGNYEKIQKFIEKEYVDILVSPRMGSVSIHLRHYHMTEVYGSSGKTAGEVVNNFLAGKLKKI